MNTIISKFSQYIKALRLSKIEWILLGVTGSIMCILTAGLLITINKSNIDEQKAAKTHCIVSIMTTNGAKSYQTTLYNIETHRNTIEFTGNGKIIKSTNYSYECDEPK